MSPDPVARLAEEDEIQELLRNRSNWGRWGEGDQLGTLNLIPPAKRAAAASLVQDGRTASLSREIVPEKNDEAGAVTCELSFHSLDEKSVAAMDYFGLSYHGFATTHIDALCHVWQDGKLWNGRDGATEMDASGARWGDIEKWGSGVFTRAVLLDIPAHRGTDYVTPDRPVTGEELEEVVADLGLKIEPGDAVLVHSGRNQWNRDQEPWETLGPRWKNRDAQGVRPGLHASCMSFLREHDVAVLMWDMMDLSPSGYSFAWSVHAAIAAFGLAVVDNVDFEAALSLSRELQRWEFLVVIAPLRVRGGTGSPVNPLAIF
jgi:kynurenine formamidase